MKQRTTTASQAPLDRQAHAQRAQLAQLEQPWALIEKAGIASEALAETLAQTLDLVDPATLAQAGDQKARLRGFLPALGAADLGSREFCRAHRSQAAYVVGAMANGITSVAMVKSAAKAGYLAIFGAAGLSLDEVRSALVELGTLEGLPWGCNLIYTPHEAGWEAGLVDLCLEYAVPTVCASAYLDLSPEIVRLRAKGLHRDEHGQIVAPRRLIVKLSRVELARKFLAPPPATILQRLVQSGKISAQEAELAAQLPVATELTVEADSGGHTDNRPSLAQFPAVLALQQEMGEQHPQVLDVHLGAAGGLGTPAAIAAAFAMGAAYVVTGSINQACIESGSSDKAREMLAQCGQADVAMAPAADMFEMGIKLQVLKRGTMFAMRAQKLYDVYREYPSYEAIPDKARAFIEDRLFCASVSTIWDETQRYWQARDPKQLAKAQQDPKHRMALLFRWYLGQASRWANQGHPDRQADYQIWCGPAMGAFNAWAQGTPLANAQARGVAKVAQAMMTGAALHTRAHLARLSGLALGAHDLAQLERAVLFPPTSA